MISLRVLDTMFVSAEQRARILEAVSVVLGGIAVASLVLLPKAGWATLVACAGLAFFLAVSEVFSGKTDRTLLFWAAFFPLGYHFASFPAKQSIITLDRVIVLLVFLGFLLARSSSRLAMPKKLRNVGIAWLAFTVVACASLTKSPSLLNGARVVLDSLLLPLLLAWCVVALFDVRGYLLQLHTAVCTSALISAAVAVGDIVTGKNLLPLAGSAMNYAGGIVRPNGPFESNDLLALIGGVSLFFLLFLRTTLGPSLSPGRKALHFLGLAAAFGMALMPMFRSVALTLFVVLIIDTLWERGTNRRALRLALIGAFAGLIVLIAVFAPQLYEDRSSSENVYGRVAEFKQSYHVFVDHPFLGVGFMNFHDFVAGDPAYLATYQGVFAPDWPHDNMAQVLTETGLLGFAPYVLTQLLLFAAMWQLRQVSRSGYLASKYFLYFFLTYWITGLTESSGYGPLNLWYCFALAVVYKYVLTVPDPVQPAETELTDESYNPPGKIALPAFLR